VTSGALVLAGLPVLKTGVQAFLQFARLVAELENLAAIQPEAVAF
jgi:hypothetical protein